MNGYIIEAVLPSISTFFIGALGGAAFWWITHWIGDPILELEKGRRDTYALWHCYQHAAKDWHEDKIAEIVDKLHTMAALLDAIRATSSVSRWYCEHVRGWNLSEAQAKLRSLTNAKMREERLILWHELQQALRLPLSDTTERIERIRNRIDRRDA